MTYIHVGFALRRLTLVSALYHTPFPLSYLHAHPDMSYEESRAAVQRAVAFLRETDGLLKIDDILPLLPDFSIIDDVKVSRGCSAVHVESALRREVGTDAGGKGAIRLMVTQNGTTGLLIP